MKIGLDISIWRQFNVDLTLDFGYIIEKQQIPMSTHVVIGHQINIDIRCWIYIEFWSPDVATKIEPNIAILWRYVPAGKNH